MNTESRVSRRGDVALGETLVHESVEPPDGVPRTMPTGHARYTRGRELGRGGMGQVLEATDLQFNRIVAVKVTTSDGASTRRRFTTEALVTGHLEHPGIPSVYERGVDDGGRPFYAMRRVQGKTLAALLAMADTRDKRLALLPIVTRVAQTIGFAHDRGVVHRDIKPDNILVGEHGETVVLDWGLARVRGVPGDGPETGPSVPLAGSGTVHGAVLGTPAYMAPEQAAGEHDRIDERSDVFALGALLYHVLTGDAPYRGTSLDELLAAAKAVNFAPIASVAPEIPRELAAICAKATAREPAQRYRDAHEMAGALEAFAASAVLGRPSRAIQLAFDGLTIVLVLLCFVAVFMVTQIVSSTHEQGPMGYVALGLGAIGTIAGTIEWSTRGRYHLAPLTFALAVCTLLIALGGTASGVGKVFGSANELVSNTEFRMAVSNGLYEAIGAIAVGSTLAAFQLLVWAAGRRRTLATAKRDTLM